MMVVLKQEGSFLMLSYCSNQSLISFQANIDTPVTGGRALGIETLDKVGLLMEVVIHLQSC